MRLSHFSLNNLQSEVDVSVKFQEIVQLYVNDEERRRQILRERHERIQTLQSQLKGTDLLTRWSSATNEDVLRAHSCWK